MNISRAKDYRGHVLAFGLFVLVLLWGLDIRGNPPQFVRSCDPMVSLDK